MSLVVTITSITFFRFYFNYFVLFTSMPSYLNRNLMIILHHWYLSTSGSWSQIAIIASSHTATSWAQWQSDAKFCVISISKSSICQCPESRWEQITNLYLCCSEGLSMKSFLLDCQVLRWSKCKRCSENIELKYLSSAGEREKMSEQNIIQHITTN